DGDALFFSRDLAIEGDTGAVVALRNAVDGAEIDLIEDLVSNLGPFAGPSRRAIEAARSLFGKMAEDLETLRAAAIAPALRGGQASSAAICRLEKKMDKAAAGRRRAPGRAS
ncbi:MAG TPA: lipid carrier protein, partial [Rhodospirillales bacterium]|nr:lipid carrier protein [Rhodospirillales bacterium]